MGNAVKKTKAPFLCHEVITSYHEVIDGSHRCT
jgi:hypothetical protein